MKSPLKPTAELLYFFLMAFAIAWGTWFPSFLHPDTIRLLSLIGLFAPAIAALTLSFYSDKWIGIKELLARYGRIPFGLPWYVVTIFLVPALFGLSMWLDHLFFRTIFQNIFLPNPPYFIFIAFVWLMFINSGEEIGWRGFALPRLIAIFKSPWYATLLLGILWSAWHLPIYLIPGQSSFPLSLFFLFTVGLSFIYTVVYNKTKASLFSAAILHASTDVVPRIINITLFKPTTWLILGILTWAGAIILIFSDKNNWQQPLKNSAVNAP